MKKLSVDDQKAAEKRHGKYCYSPDNKRDECNKCRYNPRMEGIFKGFIPRIYVNGGLPPNNGNCEQYKEAK